MIAHDIERCVLCGLCVDVCHETCLSLDAGVWQIDRALCSTCAQCIAVCPRQALSWDGVAPLPNDASLLPTPEQMVELYQQRRSMRFFSGEPIDRALLAEIVAQALDAPAHGHTMRAIVARDPASIRQLERILMRFVRMLYRILVQPRWMTRLMASLTPAFCQKDAVKIQEAVARDCAWPSDPAAIVFLVNDRRAPLSSESAQYALANVMYYAQVRGIGSCLWGNAQIFLDRHRAARRLLGVGRHERIYAGLMLGYPGTRFRNKVQGRALPVTWV